MLTEVKQRKRSFRQIEKSNKLIHDGERKKLTKEGAS